MTGLRRSRVVVGTLLLVAASIAGAEGQVLRGVVLDDQSQGPIPGALVRVRDTEGTVLGIAVADSLGRYSAQTPGPGEYRIVAQAYGYYDFESLLLAVGERPAYAVDIELARSPVPLAGLVVNARRFAAINRGLRLEIGVSPASLRVAPMLRPQIEDHLARGHDVADMMRSSAPPGIITRTTSDGLPCFQWRNRQCLPVYLNGMVIVAERVPLLPLDMMELAVVMTPGESVAYPGGALLLYTPGWVN